MSNNWKYWKYNGTPIEWVAGEGLPQDADVTKVAFVQQFVDAINERIYYLEMFDNGGEPDRLPNVMAGIDVQDPEFLLPYFNALDALIDSHWWLSNQEDYFDSDITTGTYPLDSGPFIINAHITPNFMSYRSNRGNDSDPAYSTALARDAIIDEPIDTIRALIEGGDGQYVFLRKGFETLRFVLGRLSHLQAYGRRTASIGGVWYLREANRRYEDGVIVRSDVYENTGLYWPFSCSTEHWWEKSRWGDSDDPVIDYERTYTYRQPMNGYTVSPYDPLEKGVKVATYWYPDSFWVEYWMDFGGSNVGGANYRNWDATMPNGYAPFFKLWKGPQTLVGSDTYTMDKIAGVDGYDPPSVWTHIPTTLGNEIAFGEWCEFFQVYECTGLIYT